MITFLIFFCSIVFVVLGYGLLIKRVLINDNLINNFGVGETGILGFYIILIISLLLHFFTALNAYLVFLIYIIGFVLFFSYRKHLNFLSKKNTYLFIILLILPGLISIKGHPDFEWYHLPYINYLKDFKITFGIVNLNDLLGFGQTWIDILALLRFPNVGAKGSNIIPAVFAIFFLFSVTELISKSKNSSLKVFCYIILIVFIAKFNKINEYGGHVPPILVGTLVNIYFYKLITDKNSFDKELIFKILIFFSFALLLRINYIFIFPLIIYISIKFKFEILYFLKNKKILFLILFIPLLYFTKNFIHTGCLSYPVESTCFSKDHISWSAGKDFSKLRYDGIQAGVRGWNEHVIIDGDIEDRTDYLIPLSQNKILSHSQYVQQYIEEKNFYWVKYWFKSGDVIKILNNILIILFCFIVLFIVNKIFYLNKRYFDTKFFILLPLFFLQLILWFLLTPQTIYGGDVAVVVFISSVAVFFLQNLDIELNKNKLSIIFLFFISLTYFEYKNINRTYNEYFTDIDNLKYFPWIKIKENIYGEDYSSLFINDVKINIKYKTQGRKLGLADECGNIDMFCVPVERFQCIEKILDHSNYYFIIGNEKQCIELLKNRAYY